MKYKLKTPMDGVTFAFGIINMVFVYADILTNDIDWSTLLSLGVGILCLFTAGMVLGDDD